MLLFQLTPETADAVRTVWWIGLILALIVTLIDVMLLLRVIRAARKINGLAARTLTAAGGIADNTAAIKNLAATNDVAAALIAGASPIVNVADALDKKLAAVSRHFGRRA